MIINLAILFFNEKTGFCEFFLKVISPYGNSFCDHSSDWNQVCSNISAGFHVRHALVLDRP